jgi:hypothetical protein
MTNEILHGIANNPGGAVPAGLLMGFLTQMFHVAAGANDCVPRSNVTLVWEIV